VQRFLAVAENHLAHAGGGAAELAVLAWLRGLVPLTASELDQHRWPAGAAREVSRASRTHTPPVRWGTPYDDPVGDLPPERDGR
jgi:hypothetical protein